MLGAGAQMQSVSGLEPSDAVFFLSAVKKTYHAAAALHFQAVGKGGVVFAHSAGVPVALLKDLHLLSAALDFLQAEFLSLVRVASSAQFFNFSPQPRISWQMTELATYR